MTTNHILSDEHLRRRTRRVFRNGLLGMTLTSCFLVYQSLAPLAKVTSIPSQSILLNSQPPGARLATQYKEIGTLQFGQTHKATEKFHGTTPRLLDLRDPETRVGSTVLLRLPGHEEGQYVVDAGDRGHEVQVVLLATGVLPWLQDRAGTLLAVGLLAGCLTFMLRARSAFRQRTLPRARLELEGLQPGTVLDHYRIDRILGAGGMGQVFEATDLDLGEKVGVKVLHEQYSLDSASRSRFLREINILRQLNHPHIVHLRNWGQVGEQLFLVMDFVEGSSLQSQIGQSPVDWKWAVHWCAQAAEGLREAARKGIVHRDIKPANLMLTTTGTVKLLDFGIASDSSARISAAGEVRGTPGYTAPELFDGIDPDWRSDLYSLAVMLYTALAGHPPFTASHHLELLRLHLHASVPELPEPCAPEHLRQAVLRWLSKDPSQRAGSWDEVIEFLNRADLSLSTP